jgi:hypothetical protein
MRPHGGASVRLRIAAALASRLSAQKAIIDRHLLSRTQATHHTHRDQPYRHRERASRSSSLSIHQQQTASTSNAQHTLSRIDTCSSKRSTSDETSRNRSPHCPLQRSRRSHGGGEPCPCGPCSLIRRGRCGMAESRRFAPVARKRTAVHTQKHPVDIAFWAARGSMSNRWPITGAWNGAAKRERTQW